MQPFHRLIAVATTHVDDASIRARIATNAMWRGMDHGDFIVDCDGVRLDAFCQNPVVLWENGIEPVHGSLPVASVTQFDKSADRIDAIISFDVDHAFSRSLLAKYRRGILKAFTVGVLPLRVDVESHDGVDIICYRESELIQVSAVAYAPNPDTLVF